jgi:hypothetical protein
VKTRAFWIAIIIAAICASALLTLYTWPPYNGSSWELTHSPAWWQFEWLEAIGVLLSILPSYLVFRLDSFFASAEHLRGPFVVLSLTIEVLSLCVFIYRIVPPRYEASGITSSGPGNGSQ